MYLERISWVLLTRLAKMKHKTLFGHKIIFIHKENHIPGSLTFLSLTGGGRGGKKTF